RTDVIGAGHTTRTEDHRDANDDSAAGARNSGRRYDARPRGDRLRVLAAVGESAGTQSRAGGEPVWRHVSGVLRVSGRLSGGVDPRASIASVSGHAAKRKRRG